MTAAKRPYASARRQAPRRWERVRVPRSDAMDARGRAEKHRARASRIGFRRSSRGCPLARKRREICFFQEHDDFARLREKQMRVEQLMDLDAPACSSSDTLEKAAALMAECGTSFVAVVDESRHPLGLITDREVWMAAYEQHAPFAAVLASSAVRRKAWTCAPSEEVIDVERRMQKNGIGCAAVVNELGELMGLLSLGRIAVCREP